MALTGSAGRFVSREELQSLKNVFLLNYGNKDFLLGAKKRRPGAPTLIAPILLLLLCSIVTGCPAISAVGLGGQGGVFWLMAVIFAALFLFPVGLMLRKYRRERRFDTRGQLLVATVTSVSARERTETANRALTVMSILAFILDLLSVFSETGADLDYGGPGDFFELTIEYAVTLPDGATISGTGKANRPDLREGGLPAEGNSVVLLYLDDRHYKIM